MPAFGVHVARPLAAGGWAVGEGWRGGSRVHAWWVGAGFVEGRRGWGRREPRACVRGWPLVSGCFGSVGRSVVRADRCVCEAVGDTLADVYRDGAPPLPNA